MFEINSKPVKITIQHKNSNGLWTDDVTLEGKRRKFSYDEVRELLYLYRDLTIGDKAIRVINEYGKTILSSSSVLFCEMLNNHDLITVKKFKEEEMETYIRSNNPFIKNYRDFQRIIASHKGIRRWQSYPVEKSDDYLVCGRLTLRDGTIYTVAFH